MRTTRIQVGSRLIGEYVYHPEGAIAAVRNQSMSNLSPDQWCDRLEWLYGKYAFMNEIIIK